ncbi:non-ribosomal peptide synthetase [Donghicola mangrovi]|uniref:AMP-binding protein n=1 Tax=Donghicola mangrovi TaxID=2729614 RepID=A0A850QA23_9RHOB|nr:non-ribosomal peptide synthetase [Donghicola mangrovi]NVO25744.1 AMP-binding protein [Donghicola mangrovi]
MYPSITDLSKFSDNVALISPAEGLQITYADLLERVRRKQAELPSRRSLVFIQAKNSVESIVNYLAVVAAGHPVHILEDLDSDKGQALVAHYRPNLMISEDRIQNGDNTPIDLHPELEILLSTSGSTGTAKFVKLSQQNMASNAHAICGYLGLTSADRAFCHLKPYYSFGLSIINSHLMCGGSLVLSDHSMIDDAFWTDLQDTGATSFSGVPYNFETLLHRGFDPARFPALRYATQAGGKLDAQLVRHFAEAFGACGKEFVVMYGQTEAAPRISWLPANLAPKHPDSIGKAIPGGRLYLVDSEGNQITDIQAEGELAYEGPNVMMGYAENRDALASDETPARLLTGDIAKRLDGDLFRIIGRSSRFIKPFGVRIGLDEVQSLIKERHPLSAVTGTDQELILGLEGDHDLDLQEELRGLCVTRFGLPAAVITVKFFDKLPLLANGKIDFRAIIEQPGAQPSVGFFSWLGAKISEALGFTDRQSETVMEAFYNALQTDRISSDKSFEDLGGDSLSYVALSLELERLLGDNLPENWTSMPLGALEDIRETRALSINA